MDSFLRMRPTYLHSVYCTPSHLNHKKPLLESSWGPRSQHSNIYRTAYSHNWNCSTTQSNFCPAALPLQQFSPCSICLSRTNTVCQTIMGKRAQEMPLMQHTFTGVSLGNAEHLTLCTISITFPFANPSDATISDCSSGKMPVVSSCPAPFRKTQEDALISCISSDFIGKALGQMF